MSTSVMIAFLPTQTDWCKQDLPHLTLVFCGQIVDLPLTALNAIAKDAATVARTTKPFSLDVTGVEVFGDEEKVDVLTFYSTPQLDLARTMVEKWNASQYKEFKPHATIGPEGSADGIIPTRLYFEQLLVAWGNRHLIFPLGSYY